MIDLKLLQTFCSTDDMRLGLQSPLTINGYTYATDGRIIIKVPAIDGVPETTKEILIARICAEFSGVKNTGRFLPVPPPDGNCSTCLGLKKIACVFCDCCGWKIDLATDIPCLDCEGSGKGYNDKQVPFEDHELNPIYLRKLLTLPNCKIASNLDSNNPVSIMFDGGQGLLMPMLKSRNVD